MDALSDLLRTIDLSGVIFLRANLGETFGITIPPPTLFHPIVKAKTSHHRLAMFHIVREGKGVVEVEGFEPETLHEGDLIIILDDLNHCVVDRAGRPTVPSSELPLELSGSAAPPALHVGSGERRMRLICGMLQFEDRGFNPAFAALPPFLLIRRDEGPPNEWLRSNLDHIIREAESGRPGSDTLLSRLTELLFVETLRSFFERVHPEEGGWFSALKDPVVGKALQFIHASPERRFTLVDIAKHAGASRSTLVARFTELLEMAPMTYATRWRMRLAMRLLQAPELPISEIAARTGYESESAFHRAFKREAGVPPATFRKNLFELPNSA